MKKLTHAEILKERLTNDESLNADKFPVSLMLHNIRSNYNVGSMFRTTDSAGLNELILCGFTPHPPGKEIAKTALGSIDSVKWQYFEDIKDAINHQKQLGIKVIALELTDKKKDYTTLTKDDYPLCIVVGNELVGIEDEILSMCDDAIEIPMHGVKHSLNVSVSAGVAVYEAIRKWKELIK